MKTFDQQINPEKKEKFGCNVMLVIDLMRHPEKEYATGKLSSRGKQDLITKLNDEYSDTEFDTIKAYVSPHTRGQEAIEPIEQFLRKNGINTNIGTKNALGGSMEKVGSGLKDALIKIFSDKKTLTKQQISKALVANTSASEPPSKVFETAANEIIIKEFFERNFPDSPMSGRDIALGLHDLMKHFARMARRFYSDSRVKFILISHSGVIEHLVKLMYLKNHPELKAEDVSAEDIGGLLQYMSGPRITIISDNTGKQSANLHFQELNLNYSLD